MFCLHISVICHIFACQVKRSTMLATRKQITYLQSLADRAESIRRKHPSLIPPGLYYQKWEDGMTSEKASLRIQFYQSILDKADQAMNPAKHASKTEDLPE